MAIFALAITLSALTGVCVGLVAVFLKCCGRYYFSEAPPFVLTNIASEENKHLTSSEYGTVHQINHSPDEFSMSESGQFIQYENLFAKAEKAISAAAKESRRNHDGMYINEDHSEYDVTSKKLVRCYSSESLNSVNSESSVIEDTLESLGQVEVTLEYVQSHSRLHVTVVQARDLRSAWNHDSPTDSFVQVYVLPDKEVKGQTKVYRRSANPVYNERLTMIVRKDALCHRTVRVEVCGLDRYQQHGDIGIGELKLGAVEWFPGPFSTWIDLIPKGEKSDSLGDILFSLSYLPTAERLTMVVVKARGLKWKGGKKSGDPYVKVYLMIDGKKINKKKTSVKKGDECPIYNEAMIFSVPSNLLETNITVRCTVAEYTSGGKDPHIGHVLVGPNSKGTGLTHWNQMRTTLRKPIAMWHALRL
ncbi:synaptotagmin-12-like isoform X1 [Apostichopus japonicus]